MIERYVYIKLRDDLANAAGRADVVAAARELLPGVKGVKGVRAGAAADPDSARAWDVSLAIQLGAITDLDDYMADPAHRAFADLIHERVAFIKAWNFDLGS